MAVDAPAVARADEVLVVDGAPGDHPLALGRRHAVPGCEDVLCAGLVAGDLDQGVRYDVMRPQEHLVGGLRAQQEVRLAAALGKP